MHTYIDLCVDHVCEFKKYLITRGESVRKYFIYVSLIENAILFKRL